jgi:hypothetical protein
MATAGEAIASMATVEETITVVSVASPITDIQGARRNRAEAKPTQKAGPMQVNRAPVQLIMIRPTLHRIADLRTTSLLMLVDRVPVHLTPNRTAQHRTPQRTHRPRTARHRMAAGDKPTTTTTSNR